METTWKMDPELKSRWVAALRSGKYAQGRHSLRSADDKFCCLGVLADVLAPEDWEKREHAEQDYRFQGTKHTLRWEEVPYTVQGDLVNLNDIAPRKSFTEIADWIEENI